MNFIFFFILKETSIIKKYFLSEFDFQTKVTHLSEMEKNKVNFGPNIISIENNVLTFVAFLYVYCIFVFVFAFVFITSCITCLYDYKLV